MGKTETGAVWLDKQFLSPYDYWQFWRNSDDRDVIKFLKFFTDMNVEEVERISNNDINELKVLLANKTTSMLHGIKEAVASEKTAKEVFSENSSGKNLPSIKINKNKINIIDLIIFTKLESSKSEIRRLIKGNAIKIDNEIIRDDRFEIKKKDSDKNFMKLSIGKKRHLKIEFS